MANQRDSYYTVILVFEDQFKKKHERSIKVLAKDYNDAKKKVKQLDKEGLVFKLKTVR